MWTMTIKHLLLEKKYENELKESKGVGTKSTMIKSFFKNLL